MSLHHLFFTDTADISPELPAQRWRRRFLGVTILAWEHRHDALSNPSCWEKTLLNHFLIIFLRVILFNEMKGGR